MEVTHATLRSRLRVSADGCRGAVFASRSGKTCESTEELPRFPARGCTYELAGSGDPVVLIHGAWGDIGTGMSSLGCWLSQNRVLRYDVRGHGQSSPPAEGVAYSDEEDLANLLDHLRIRNPHVVGFDGGAHRR